MVDTQNPDHHLSCGCTTYRLTFNQCGATGVALGSPTTADNCGVATVTNNAPVQFPSSTTVT
ncbi:MAG: hypothetical protein R2756_13035 [Bacteroidales bacterium]